MLGDRMIAQLDDIRPDMPWYVASFTGTEAYAEVEPLLRAELALTESDDGFDADEWQKMWEALWQRGLSLRLPDGTNLHRDFAVHVYDDGTARFRY
jgi:hypothetical protein